MGDGSCNGDPAHPIAPHSQPKLGVQGCAGDPGYACLLCEHAYTS